MPATCCCVPKCSKRGGHHFPKDDNIRKLWLIAIKRDKFAPTEHSVVCQNHFREEDYLSKTVFGSVPVRKLLKKDAVPSVFNWTKAVPKSLLDRKNRLHRRNAAEPVLPDSCLENEIEVAADEVAIEIQPTRPSTSTGVFTEASTLTTEDKILSQDKQTQTPYIPVFDFFSLQHDDKAVHFYTGLENFQKVEFVLQSLGPAAYTLNYMYGQISSVSVFNQFIIVLIKLRRHKTNFELSRMFGISESDVYNIFCTWIRFMALQWKELDLWPSRDLVRFYSPTDFKAKYPSTRVIIDGTEMPVKKPSLPTAQQSTFSTYKNRNTVKVLVGASPGGCVTYVSPAYGGSTSDRQIIERSSVLRKFDSGDSIMADKGFDVQDLFAPYDVTVNIPTFFKKKNQMQSKTILADRKLASKRVHIERIIGLGKTFKILTKPLNTSETQLASDLIFICYMLCNFRKCIVPRNA